MHVGVLGMDTLLDPCDMGVMLLLVALLYREVCFEIAGEEGVLLLLLLSPPDVLAPLIINPPLDDDEDDDV